jgi:hypothetical protein
MTRVLIVISEPPGGTSANLFAELAAVIGEKCDVRVLQRTGSLGGGLRQIRALLGYNFRAIGALFGTDTVILHVFVAPWLPLVLMAVILRKKIVIFQWDVYPVTLNGLRYNTSLSRRFADRVERFLLWLTPKIVVPSKDFLPFVNEDKVAAVIPLWPQRQMAVQPHCAQDATTGPVRIGFAGQINRTRGVEALLRYLAQDASQPVQLHVFSNSVLDRACIEDSPHITVVQHGFLQRDALQTALQDMHFGLICLSAHMDQPGYPSKTYDYLAAGLPVLYFGRPLPAFTDPLKAAGLGVDLVPDRQVNLASAYATLSHGFDDRRACYLAAHELKWGALADIL